MSTPATHHARQAREHSEDAARQVNQVVNNLKETLSYLAGTTEDAVDLAAKHLRQVEETVGSATAGNLAETYEGISSRLNDTPTNEIAHVIDLLEPLVGLLTEAGNDVESLAAQLGA